MANEVCRKAKYSVKIELGCYKIDEAHPLLPGFEEETFEDGVYAVKSGVNSLEKNSWRTNPNRPYIITGTVGERWPVKPTDLANYEVNPAEITVEPKEISTKDPSDQPFMTATFIPMGTQIKVITKWAFRDDGTIDETQVATSNLESSAVSHAEGDYVVAKHIDGEPEYMDLPEEVRNTKEAATKYSPRIINGSIMKTTYDHASTKEEIEAKYAPKIITGNPDQAMVAAAANRFMEMLSAGIDPMNPNPQPEDTNGKRMGFAKVSILGIITIIVALGIIIFGVFLLK